MHKLFIQFTLTHTVQEDTLTHVHVHIHTHTHKHIHIHTNLGKSSLVQSALLQPLCPSLLLEPAPQGKHQQHRHQYHLPACVKPPLGCSTPWWQMNAGVDPATNAVV